MELNTEQTQAFEEINDFLKSSKQIYSLQGLAGVGKTHLAGIIADSQPNAELVALTAKAASVLTLKSSKKGRTIHSLFYKLVDAGFDEIENKRILKFERNFFPGSLEGTLVILDESSMVNDQIGNDLRISGAKILACGDPGQLEPITGKQYFKKANFTLKEIQRQALDSAIIRQSHSVRNTGIYKADGDDFKITSQLTKDDLIKADMVLCWTNKTRHAYNEVLRELKGFTSPHPQEGENVMCLKNAHHYGISNGSIYTLSRPFSPTRKTVYLKIDGNELRIPNCVFLKPGENIGDYDKEDITTFFDYANVASVHKFQGSEADNVILIDEYTRLDQRKNWLYTGLTRAKKRILIQR